jgi:hypothetical protein
MPVFSKQYFIPSQFPYSLIPSLEANGFKKSEHGNLRSDDGGTEPYRRIHEIMTADMTHSFMKNRISIGTGVMNCMDLWCIRISNFGRRTSVHCMYILLEAR